MGKERKIRASVRFVMLVITTAVLLILPAGYPPAKAAQGSAPYSLTVYVADKAFVKDDPVLADVTLKIYKLAGPGEEIDLMADRDLKPAAETGFGITIDIQEKGTYLVVPVMGDEMKTDHAGNATVRTTDWTYTFGPMKIAIPAKDPTEAFAGDAALEYGDCSDAVIYAKAERRPNNGCDVTPEPPKRIKANHAHKTTVTTPRNVKTGDAFPMLSLIVLAAAVATVVIWRKGSGTFTR